MPERRGVDVSIVAPTYNERENISRLVAGIRANLAPRWDYEVIVVDDSSPDGTAALVCTLAAADPQTRLVERPGKLGLGSAVVDGFRIARGRYWVMMDADLSHSPEDLPRLIEALADADIAVGSRYVQGGRIANWPPSRRFISQRAASLGRFLLHLDVRDPASGFAAFRREAVEPMLPELDPKGFKLLMEILVKTPAVRIVEVPIAFANRQRGKSKFGTREVIAFLQVCMSLRKARGGKRLTRAVG